MRTARGGPGSLRDDNKSGATFVLCSGRHSLHAQMRALFRPFALHAAYTPIETIVFFAIVGSLAYFYILGAVKHSAFLDPPYSQPPTLEPTHALFKHGEWVSITNKSWNAARSERRAAVLELQQLVISLDVKAKEVRLLHCLHV